MKATLRHRPDRLVLGEIRGGGAFDLLDALNTKHAGSISTVHANSALQALARLATLTLRADIEIPCRAIKGEIGDLINLVVHIERKEGRRQVKQALRVHGFNADASRYENDIDACPRALPSRECKPSPGMDRTDALQTGPETRFTA